MFSLGRVLGVFAHALKVDGDYRLVSHNPSIVSWRNQCDIARFEFLLCAVVHAYVQYSGYLILEVWSFAAFRLHDRLDMGGPSPSRLECGSSDRSSSNVHEFKFSFLEVSCLIRGVRTLEFHLSHFLSHNVGQMARCSKRLSLYKTTRRVSSTRVRQWILH
jgi:hypothetical protein